MQFNEFIYTLGMNIVMRGTLTVSREVHYLRGYAYRVYLIQFAIVVSLFSSIKYLGLSMKHLYDLYHVKCAAKAIAISIP